MKPKYISLEEGMMIMDEAIVKARKIIQGYPDTKFTGEEYQRFYGCVFLMCTYQASSEKTMQLYEKFKKSLGESISSTILPSLVDKHEAPLLTELVLMWSNYKLMSRWLCRFFEYLDRFFLPQRRDVISLHDTCVDCFQVLVFTNLYCRFRAAAVSLINQERTGLQIDRGLLKNVLHIFLEVGEFRGINYYEDFEKAMLKETAAYYSQLAWDWLLYDSLADYIQKVHWCLNQEKGRASQYLHSSTEAKLLQVVRCKLLDQTANKLIEKQQAEHLGLVTDYQETLSKCTSMSLDEGSSASTSVEWLSALMARHIL